MKSFAQVTASVTLSMTSKPVACRVWCSFVVTNRVEYPLNFTCTQQPRSLSCGDSVEEPVAHDYFAAVDQCARDCC